MTYEFNGVSYERKPDMQAARRRAVAPSALQRAHSHDWRAPTDIPSAPSGGHWEDVIIRKMTGHSLTWNRGRAHAPHQGLGDAG